ncbi:SnoaL-like domain protein (plasmid) [Pseudoalteromonas sp. THAF3]|uniref:nuclear transport factor 2 family protein n=1 Tax=Pseudoalteromonas sp. THAF3 TaxID=2587843 RepID=UPI0012686174|nr:nuclear transport factor 2 family protein [Pseudoalteromonas sp. THAF3]QFU06716.1 SnoaL-like domain protein [Pseudoalteromonas sp. THAF3]
MNNALEQFVSVYQRLDKHNLDLLHEVYGEAIHFQDPLHEVKGLQQLRRYFANMYANVNHCTFDISQQFAFDNHAFLYWTMRFSHPKLNGGKEVAVAGHSFLQFDQGKVIHHRDYFDVGAMLYRHIPLLGKVIKLVDNKAGS